MKATSEITNISEVYGAGGVTPLAVSNPVATTVEAARIIPYARRECAADCCGALCRCGCLIAALCLCAGRCNACRNTDCAGCRGRCNPCRRCGDCVGFCNRCGGCCGGAPFTVTAFYGKGCGCRGYSVYYPYY